MTVIDEAKKALEGVTPGPWEEFTPQDGFWPPRVFSGSTVICMVDNSDMLHEEKMSNARFIAWAREGVPALLAEITAKDAEIADLQRKLRAACKAADGLKQDFMAAIGEGDTHE